MIFPFLKRTQQTRRTQTSPRSLQQQVAFAFITILLIFFFWKNYETQTQDLFTVKTGIPTQGITKKQAAAFTQAQGNTPAQTQVPAQELTQNIPSKKVAEFAEPPKLSAIKSNSTEQGLPTVKSNSTEQGLSAIKSNSTEQGLSTAKGSSTEQGLSTAKSNSTEQGLSTAKSNSTEQGLSTAKSNSTEQGLFSESLSPESLFPSKSDVFDQTNSFSPAALEALKRYGSNFQKQYAFPLLIAIYHGELPLKKLTQYRQGACIIAYSPLLQQCYIAFCPEVERHIGSKATESYESRMLDATIKEWPVRLEGVLNEISLTLNLALKKEKKVFQ